VGEGGLLKHTLAVTRMALAIAKEMERTYKIKIKKDLLLAAGLCHDIMKVSEYSAKGKKYELELPLPLDHLTLGITEMYARGFPKEVIHVVAAHHGEAGPIAPDDVESIIIHFADTLDAYANVNPH
jgi:7,8-dihydroneopterin 2',3'-cyclic phosphate phosphodiesterase